jgi:hypothetical protein
MGDKIAAKLRCANQRTWIQLTNAAGLRFRLTTIQ